jgi:hypothetical protein
MDFGSELALEIVTLVTKLSSIYLLHEAVIMSILIHMEIKGFKILYLSQQPYFNINIFILLRSF